MIFDIVIIGGGWYGCHIANELKHKYKIILLEKTNSIFGKSSYYNQNRLHLGFHYCKNYITRNMCYENYNKFLLKYGNCIEHINTNIYGVSLNSIIDYKTYCSIYDYEKIPFCTNKNDILTNIDGNLILVNEHVINPDISKQYFEHELNNLILTNKNIVDIKKNVDNEMFSIHTSTGEHYTSKIVFDCTYNQLQLSKKKYKYELTISLLYKKNKKIEFDALTIVDGLFMSLYPRDMTNDIYSLTDVEFTPLISSFCFNDLENYVLTDEKIESVKQNMSDKIKKYYPSFSDNFDYVGFFTSNKTKLLSSSDSREISIDEIEPNLISVNCGKIYGIFEIETYIRNVMKLI